MRCRCKKSRHSALMCCHFHFNPSSLLFVGFLQGMTCQLSVLLYQHLSLTTKLHFPYCPREQPRGNSVTCVTTQAEMPREATGLSLSHTHVLAVILHGTKLLHQLLELLTVPATQHHPGASCMESLGTLWGGSKEETKGGM